MLAGLRSKVGRIEAAAALAHRAGCERCEGRRGHVWREGAEAPARELHRCAGCGRDLTVHWWRDVPVTLPEASCAPG